jgi:hypothetical protein
MAATDLGAWVYQSNARRVICLWHGHFSAMPALDQNKVGGGGDEGPFLLMQGESKMCSMCFKLRWQIRVFGHLSTI